jgi:hypothetical protein
MKTIVPGWTTLAEQPLVLVREYAFGPGRATAMAALLPGNQWLLMSPPNNLGADEARAFQAHGPVVALVENNGSHHLGLGPCRAHFPEAITYAAPRAAARIRKKGKDYGQLEPIAKLTPLLGDQVTVLEAEGDKIGDVVVFVRTERGSVFYAGDFIANIQRLPRNLLFRLVFTLTDSAPGLKVFNMFFRFFVADPKAARRFLVRALKEHAPTMLVPAHGDVVERADLTPTLVHLLEAGA